MREIIKNNNKEEFFKFIPNYLPEEIKEEIWTKLQDTTMPVQEFMGGTMNKQEMDKHNANMNKLRTYLNKVDSHGQMVQVPRNLTKGLKRKLYEKVGIQRGTVESEVQFLSRELFELFKENLGKKYHTGGFEGWLEGPDSIAEYEITDLTFTPRDAHEMGGAPYSIEAEADDEEMEITIDYNPVLFPEEYNNLIAELKETLRHEIEHIVQFNFMPGAEELMKKWKDGGSWVEYLTRPYEIPAFVRGLYKRAKTKKIKLIDAIDEFIEEYIDRFEGPEEIEQVRKSWVQWANVNLPNSRLNEGPLGDFVNKIKTAAIEQAKDFKDFVPLLNNYKNLTPEEKSKLETISKDILKSTAIGVTWPILGLTGHALIGAAIKKLSKGKYAGLLPSKIANVVEFKEMKESKLFSKEWWSAIIINEVLNEGGAAGHMAHPFDLPNVKTGKDLIKSFEQASDSLKN